MDKNKNMDRNKEKTLNSKETDVCVFCNKVIHKKTKYSIYRIGIITNLNYYTVGILNIEEELSDYLLSLGYHLSATQVTLLRPDILIEFFKKKHDSKRERVREVFLHPATICTNCFEKVKTEVPLK